jgi:beta-lactamase regulating signal transducer with metallopeptidase domain
MMLAVAMLVGSFAVATLVPKLLWWLHGQRVDPASLIAGWLLSVIGTLATAVAAVLLLLAPDLGVIGGIVRAAHVCWRAISRAAPPGVEQVAGLLGMTVLGTLAVRLTLIGRRQARRRRQARDECLGALRIAGRADALRPSTMWLAHSRPLAFSLPGRRGVIVATEGLAEQLTPDEVLAVLEHERAHVRGRHHLVLAISEMTAWAAPFLPLLRQAPAALADLVELAADATAARRCGARVVRDALTKVDRFDLPPAALAVGNQAVELRLHRLAGARSARGAAHRVLRTGLVGVVSVTAPLVFGGALFAVVTLVACP